MFSNRKLSLFVMMTLALSLFLAACGGGNEKEGSTGSGTIKKLILKKKFMVAILLLQLYPTLPY